MAVGVSALATAYGAFWAGPPAEIEIEPALPGIGPRTPVTVRLHEPRRGLGRVRVQAVQGPTSWVVARREHRPRPWWRPWGQGTNTDEIVVEVGKETLPELVAGELTFRVEVERAVSWLRRPPDATAEVLLPVSFRPPPVEVLSAQTYVAQGGCEAVVYRLPEGAARHGVRSGDWWFPGYPLGDEGSGEQFALFAAPYDIEDGGQIRLWVEDELGNRAELPFVDRFDPRPVRQETARLSDAFLSKVVAEILARTPELEDQGDLLGNYLAINGELRRRNRERLRELARHSEPAFLWRRPFLSMPGSQVMSAFAVRRAYVHGDQVVDHQVHLGFDLASTRHAPVPAANDGVVAFTGYLGIYGNLVVLDHGYGLQSVYAHLSSIAVGEGQRVARGQELGRSGATGLAGGDHLHFAILLQGLPVNPLEWWDARWLSHRIAAKLGGAFPDEG